jgi:hypothetical protein
VNAAVAADFQIAERTRKGGRHPAAGLVDFTFTIGQRSD